MLAFVLMPFDPEFNIIFEELIAAPLVSAGFDVKRADTLLDQQNILKDIVQSIAFADLIVADLTSLNGNVLYELGIAHGLSKPTILLTQSIEDVPFDLRSYRVIVYSTHFADAKKFTEQLGKIAAGVKHDSIKFGNPVSDFVPGIGSLLPRPDANENPSAIQPNEIEEDEAEPGILDFATDSELSMRNISSYMGQITLLTSNLSENFTKRTEEINSLPHGMAGRTAKISQVAKAIAGDISRYSDELEEQLPEFRTTWDSLIDSTTGLITHVKVEKPEDVEAMINLRKQFVEFESTISATCSSTLNSRETYSQLNGLSRDLNRAVRRAQRTLDGHLEEFSKGQSYANRMINLIDDQLSNTS